jgi:hypothetical protein
MNENRKISNSEFLRNRDETGNEIFVFLDTGKQYHVEYIKPRGHNVTWGDVDPATKKLTGSYGGRNNGAIDASESVITKENGYDNIVEGQGASAEYNVNKLHNEWKAKNGY